MNRKFFLALCAIVIFSCGNAYADFPRPWQLNFQEAASPVMEQLTQFHDLLLVVITAVSVFVLLLLIYVCLRFSKKANPVPAKFAHNGLIEVIWTVVPVLILVALAIPSIKLLYYVDVTPKAEMTLKVVGHQWYWEYQYPDIQDSNNTSFAFDSYIIPDKDLKPGQKRLLEVDNRVVLPVGTNIRVLTTSADVIHDWAMPALGIKIDAVPGRINETWLNIQRPGVYYGQCSELCGVGHGFMPIAIQAVTKEEYQQWLKEAKDKFANNNDGRIKYAAK